MMPRDRCSQGAVRAPRTHLVLLIAHSQLAKDLQQAIRVQRIPIGKARNVFLYRVSVRISHERVVVKLKVGSHLGTVGVKHYSPIQHLSGVGYGDIEMIGFVPPVNSHTVHLYRSSADT